uniref:Uncharacterized protein MANES_13G129900 n=1 Tax=Rhizophora mucronata TaxID=61149 RepID=A0A2P2KH68_RHIMU
MAMEWWRMKLCSSIPRVYIVWNQDNIINEDLQRWMIQNNPSDHMVVLSKPFAKRSTFEFTTCLGTASLCN